ncbi:ArnT family glycosyltransferase [Allisonella histaminiformans]|uniref:ArnT family glycosyltransferase n=1 Tax=Allisonella histaminiformans TaxID=209880 RepID=UPI0022E9910C|nr:glycosyltransferase family 39 protein [Allisonella histaminiformans]
MKLTKNNRLWIIIFLVSFLFLLWGNQYLPVTDPVESNYALTAKEMAESGNWLSPTIYGHYWYDKPIMIYWLTAASYRLFGFTSLASRLPSVLAGALSAALLGAYTQRLLHNQKAAVCASLFLVTSLEFWIVSHAIITDQLLFLFTIPTMLSAFIGLNENSRKHMVIAYAAAALACLTKGPVGLVLPGLLLLLWCASMRSWKMVRRCFPWQGILCFLLIATPWYGAMIYYHGTDFISQFLGLHNVVRATSSEHPEDNHWYYYLVLLPVSLLPWTGLSFLQMKTFRRQALYQPLYRFLMIWCWGTIGFYTLMATKYVTYTYIAVIPAILLAATAIPQSSETRKFHCLLLLPALFMVIALSGGTLALKGTSWTPFYILALLSISLCVYSFRNTKKLILSISLSISALYICLVSTGLGLYLSTRSGILMAQSFHSLPGYHLFFSSYSASYTYYTGETAIRLVPSVADAEKRNPLWNEKYTMPSLPDTHLESLTGDKPVYLYVSRSNLKLFDRWNMRRDFIPVETFPSGSIYQYKK